MWGKRSAVGVAVFPGVKKSRARRRTIGVLSVAVGLAAAVLPASAAAANIGFDGPDYTAGTSGPPSGNKGESKLWFAGGSWYASMFNATAKEYHIYKLNGTSWSDTGVVLDNRDSSRQDVKAVGNELFVASHIFVENAGFTTGLKAQPMRFRKYTLSGGTYVRDISFDITTNIRDNERSETLVVDRDGNGKFWATWVQQPSSASDPHQVRVSRTNGNCSSAPQCQWQTPVQIADVAADDVSALVAFGGNIGVMWSDQSTLGNEAYRFAVCSSTTLTCGAPVNVVQGSKMADDHVDLAAFNGKVYAATKTKFLSDEKPGTMLYVRATNGTWTGHTVSPVADSRTRPIVVLDATNSVIHVLETGFHPPSTDGQSGGDIYENTSRISSISFAVSSARPVMRADMPRVDLNNVTSTKQNLTSGMGLVALASSAAGETPKTYWHSFESLGTPPSTSGGGCTIRGTNRSEVIDGTARRDIICGRGGNDIIHGFGGNDTIYGGYGNDRITGGAGADNLQGNPGADRILGGAGNDRLFGGLGADNLQGNGGADRILGASGNDRLLGGLGADILQGNQGRDGLSGGPGNDRLVGGLAKDAYYGGPGRDTLVSKDRVRELVSGGTGRDRGHIDRRGSRRDIRRSVESLF